MQIWKFEKFYFSHFTLEKTPNSWLKKKMFAKYDKYRRKTSRKCKYGNLRNFIFHILLLKKRQILGKNSKKKSLPNMINIDAKRLENANMEIWEILFFTFYSWKNAKFLVKIAKKNAKFLFAKYDKYRRKTSRKCKYGNLRNFIFHILLLKKRQILGKNSKKNFAKYDKNRRKTSRKCKYGNLRNFIFHILLLKKRQILGKKKKICQIW